MFFRKKKKDTVELILHNENEQIEPRPCPFCGRQPFVIYKVTENRYLWAIVKCPRCDAKVTKYTMFNIDEKGNFYIQTCDEHPRTKAIKFWNGIP